MQVILPDTEWASLAATALVPVQVQRHVHEPLLYTHNTTPLPWLEGTLRHLTDWGDTPKAVTSAIALEFWEQAGLVIVVADVGSAVRAAPVASFLEAPILVDPSTATLEALKTEYALEVGSTGLSLPVPWLKTLRDDMALWRFQLQLYSSRGFHCDYLVVTNPHDIDPGLRLLYPGLSPAAAILAAQHRALVVADNYTVEWEIIDGLARANGESPLYVQGLPRWQRVRQDILGAAEIMEGQGHLPRFVALVGDGFAVPDYYLDLHIEFLYWSQRADNIPSLAPYASLASDLDPQRYVQEDLAVGRLVASDIDRLTRYLARTHHYCRYLPQGDWNESHRTAALSRALVIDGHRLNQPDEGGPPASPDEPFPPAGEMTQAAQEGGFNTSYLTPRNESDASDTNPGMAGLMDLAANSSLVLYNAHGGSLGGPIHFRMEAGIDPLTGEQRNHYVTPDMVAQHPFEIPTVVTVIGCYMGIYAREDEPGQHQVVALLDVGAGAVMAPMTNQAICFWKHSPQGVAAQAHAYLWQNLSAGPMPIGPAFAEAKWTAYQNWRNDSELGDEVDPYTYQLFGDPALVVYHPDHPYPEKRPVDVDIDLAYSGGQVKVDVTVRDPATGEALPAEMEFKLGGRQTTLENGDEFKRPEGNQPLQVTVTVAPVGDSPRVVTAVVGVKGTEKDETPSVSVVWALGPILLVATWCNRRRGWS